MSIETWTENWDKGDIGFHNDQVNRGLQKYLPGALNGIYGEEIPGNLKVLVPMCGKTGDLLYFYNLGHTVVGVEFIKKAAEDFFTENKLERSATDDQSVFKTPDGRLQILVADMFSCNDSNLPYPTYDVIWDRGSFQTLFPEQREEYVKLMTSFMNPTKCLYLLSFFESQSKTEDSGNPSSKGSEEIKKLFGQHCDIAILMADEWDQSKLDECELTSGVEFIFNFSPKNKTA